jgi:cytochrome c oxidase assembly protein subunit 15
VVAILAVAIVAWRTPALHPALRKLASMAAGLLVLQVILGFATFRLHLQVELLTVSHQAVGATLLGTLVVFTVFSLRDWASNREPKTDKIAGKAGAIAKSIVELRF